LGLRRLDRVLEHEPGDLTATVEAGITLAALQAELGKRGQWLSLDPPSAERATLGGILAANAAGPRRHLYGACRDLLIGLTVVGADGSIVRGGGKVVKNVAGYDLPKLYVGSFGRLLGPLGAAGSRALDGAPRDALWRALGELARGGMDDVAAVMKWGVLPTQLAPLMEEAATVARKNGLRAAITAHAGLGIATAA